MKPNSEQLTQAQLDRIEQRGMTCRDGGHRDIRHRDAGDEFQYILWERMIFADIADYDAETRTCRLIGPIHHCVAAKRELAKFDVTAKLPKQ